MVVRYLFTVFLSLLSMPLLGKSVTVLPATQQVEYGKPLWITIRTELNDKTLEKIDFTPWEELVYVDKQFITVHDKVTKTPATQIRLYPRQPGQLTLPSLRFENDRTIPVNVTVTRPVDPKSASQININCPAPVTDVWQLQQLSIFCEIDIQDSHVVFEHTRDTEQRDEIFPISINSGEIKSTKGYFRYHIGWVIIPTATGETAFSLPPVNMVRDGVITHRFYLPYTRLQVNPLPAYLPGTIPVGKVQVDQYKVVQNWLSPGELSTINLDITLNGVTETSMPAYEVQLQSNEVFQFHASQKSVIQKTDTTGISTTVRYAIPVTITKQGIHIMPAIRLQYFEPDQGVIKTFHVTGQRLTIISNWLQAVLLLLVLILLFILGKYLVNILIRIWRRYRFYTTALTQLSDMNNADQLRQIMNKMALAEGLRENITARDWYGYLLNQCGNLESVPLRLLDVMYLPSKDRDFEQLRQKLSVICRQRRLILLPGSG